MLPLERSPGRNYIRPHPSPPFLAKRHFPGEGAGGVFFEAPRGRNFIRPPFIHFPPLEGYFHEWGGWGCIKFGPVSSAFGVQKKKELFLGADKDKWLIWDPRPNTAKMSAKQEEIQQVHSWPHHKERPQIWQKKAMKLGEKKLQKDK